MVICLQRGADLHMAQLMPLPLTVSCFSKIQIDFTFLVPAHSGSPGKKAVKRLCVFQSGNFSIPIPWESHRTHWILIPIAPRRTPLDAVGVYNIHRERLAV